MRIFIVFIVNEKVLLIFLFLFGILSWILYSSSFIWDDSYFYLVIARNIILTGQQTFSNVFTTNGFHPLWLYLLTAYSYVVTLINANFIFNESYAVVLSGMIVCWGAINFWKVADLLQLPKVIFVGLPLGYLIFFQVLYSEAHVYYALLSCLTLISVNNLGVGRFAPCLIGGVCALVFLSRLDSIFIIFCYFIWYIITTKNLSPIIYCITVFLTIVTSYLITNLMYFGGIMPMSGWIKSSFPAIFLNKPLYWNSILGYNTLAGIIPILVSALILVLIKYRVDRLKQILYIYFFGSTLHLYYTILFTRFHTLYWWYYISHIILISFAIALILKVRPFPKLIAACVNVCLVLLICCALVIVRWQNVLPDESPISKLLQYMKLKGIHEKSIFVSEIPGIIAFYSRNNIIAADMVTSNEKFFNAMLSAPNAMMYLFEYCKKAGKPIEYYLHMGGGFVNLNKRGTALAITYNDPKLYPIKKPIGTLNIGHRPEYASWFTMFILWKLTEGDGIQFSKD